MTAVIETGGKQYIVKLGDVLKIEKIPGKVGDSIVFPRVLAVASATGLALSGTKLSVKATVLEHKKADKVLIFKKKRRHNYRRKVGHRQPISVIRITEISG